MQQYFQISKSLQGLQIIDLPNPAATRIRFSKAVLVVFVRVSKVGVGMIGTCGQNSLINNALSNRMMWCIFSNDFLQVCRNFSNDFWAFQHIFWNEFADLR